MWRFFAHCVLRYRFPVLIVVALVTVFMFYHATRVEITYNFAKLLPDSDSASIDYDFFRSKFGQDGTILVMGTDEQKLHNLRTYQAWAKLGEDIKRVPGIKQVASIARLNDLRLNDSLERFDFVPLQTSQPQNQHDLDTLLEKVKSLKFYDGIIFNSKTHSTIMAVTFNEKDLNTRNRLSITDSIKQKGDAFAKATGAEIHYSGLPYIRTSIARKVSGEMSFFLIVALVVTGIILFFFFKSIQPVLFSLLVVACGVIWSLGSIQLFGYQLSVLSGLIPPLIIVIGVPNCILILNKYHNELSAGAGKMRALHLAIERSSASLFFANITTSIGFAVFMAIDNKILFEFGEVAPINVMATYLLSLVLIPIIFSFLPAPKEKHLKHLEGKSLRKVLEKVYLITAHKRRVIYVVVVILTIVSLYGLSRIKANGYVVDDLPKNDPVLLDLHYFERNYGGVLPFEISIDTRKDNGIFANNARTLYKINKLNRLLGEYDIMSRPISLVDAVKFMHQVYKGGDVKYYKMPPATDLKNIAGYVKDQKQKQSQLTMFIDSSKRYTRVSVQIADIGSVKMRKLIQAIKPRIDSVFNYNADDHSWLPPGERYNIRVTGNSIMFLKGNEFLVNNLVESVVWAIILIALLMLTLFTSFRMILISIVPSLVALVITAGVMGYIGIPLKPSTILVFSIAFGISSDGTLYFLTKYRHELRTNKLSIPEAVSLTISETGVSMIYTAIVLFFGFGMFILSGFGGTQALGILLSFTLIVAYCANLVLLPAFLLNLNRRLSKKELVQKSVVDIDDV